jgi:hypothetical protein
MARIAQALRRNHQVTLRASAGRIEAPRYQRDPHCLGPRPHSQRIRVAAQPA